MVCGTYDERGGWGVYNEWGSGPDFVSLSRRTTGYTFRQIESQRRCKGFEGSLGPEGLETGCEEESLVGSTESIKVGPVRVRVYLYVGTGTTKRGGRERTGLSGGKEIIKTMYTLV